MTMTKPGPETGQKPDGEGAFVRIDWPDEDIARLTLARGAAMNTLTWEMLGALMNAFQDLRRDPPRALIVTGEGRAFCGGAHLKYFTEPDSDLADNPEGARDPYVRQILNVFNALQDLPCPTIAAINGHALGGGMEMAIACDFRIISRTARMGQPEVRLGLAPGGNGIQQLIHLVGRPRALDLILAGEAIEADSALTFGLVSSVHEPDDLDAAALTFARRFLACGPRAVAITKRAALRAEYAARSEADEIALDAVFESFSTDESREGIRAFVEKRRPRYDKLTK
ncbi:enoyl-CoA hydratase/isomerase family protein [Roseovarius sp.]|uniref:enoyl-CoA hydratase/isomerase family protein n=1 Tax=Roseovarius sp. TaxID=1486281 RepID=UPI0035646AC7